MAKKVTFITKEESINPVKLIERASDSLLVENINDCDIVLSVKYAAVYITNAVSKKLRKDSGKIVLAHEAGNNDELIKTTLRLVGSERNAHYVVEKIESSNPKVGVLYARNPKTETERQCCFVKSPERGFDLEDRLSRHQKQQEKSAKKAR